jgi:ComF family protein
MVEPEAHPAWPLGRETVFRRIADGILNLFYPANCFICSSPVSSTRELGLCCLCWGKALQKEITASRCPVCGIPFQSSAIEPRQLCGACCISLPPFSGAASFGYYTGELSKLIQGLKFKGRKNLAAPLSTLMSKTLFENWRPSEFDCVVPVPLHRRRKRERGFNQSELLAGGVAVLAVLPLESGFLHRRTNTHPQVGLSDAQRRQNVQGAFYCHEKSHLAGSRILLVDDVMTTGATAGSASLALLDAGAQRVTVLTTARAVPGME